MLAHALTVPCDYGLIPLLAPGFPPLRAGVSA